MRLVRFGRVSAALDRARAEFSVAKMADRTRAVYERALGRRPFSAAS